MYPVFNERGINMLQELGLSAVDLSKYIVTKCAVDDCPISNLQLQKILYYIQKYFLKHDSIAFYDDIEAWQFGPVVPSSYYRFCGFGAMPIDLMYFNLGSISCPESKRAVDDIILDKRNLNPWILVQETHKPGGAWDTTYDSGKGNHKVISKQLIREENE